MNQKFQNGRGRVVDRRAEKKKRSERLRDRLADSERVGRMPDSATTGGGGEGEVVMILHAGELGRGGCVAVQVQRNPQESYLGMLCLKYASGLTWCAALTRQASRQWGIFFHKISRLLRKKMNIFVWLLRKRTIAGRNI